MSPIHRRRAGYIYYGLGDSDLDRDSADEQDGSPWNEVNEDEFWAPTENSVRGKHSYTQEKLLV